MATFFNKLTFANIFCVSVFGLCFGYLWWLSAMSFSHLTTPTDISEIKMSVIGALGTVVGYVVGSSASSRAKDDMIKDSIKNETNP